LTVKCGESANVAKPNTKPWSEKWGNNSVAYGSMNNQGHPLLETQGLGQKQGKNHEFFGIVKYV